MNPTAASRRERIAEKSKTWRTGHMIMHSVTGVLAMASSIAYYLTIERCDYLCYQYNTVLMIHNKSREEYEPKVTENTDWYHTGYCYDTFVFAMVLTIFSAVAMGMSLVFGRGGTDTTDYEHIYYFRFMPRI
jgi:hypothetical protein